MATTEKSHPEYKYLNIMQDILDNGETKGDRTGVGTLSLFSRYMDFDISQEFPLLTTKKTNIKSIINELLWFLSGNHDVTWLQNNNCHIWDGNSSDAKYLEASGNDKYDAGKNYGFQLRNFNGTNRETDTPNGIDQLKYVIDLLKNNPTSRRILFSYWNPAQIGLQDTCLPPCHLLYVFNVNTRTNTLNCHMTQRSADFFLGVPFNIASLATLVYILCHVTGYKPGKISIVTVDTHLYTNHTTQAKKQLTRTPHPFPKLAITKKFEDDADPIEFIESLTFDDFKVIDYKCHKGIKAPMAV